MLTSIGAMLRELLEALPTVCSVAFHRDGELRPATRALVLDGSRPEFDPDDGFVVPPALLERARWRDGDDPERPDCVIVRQERGYQLLVPMRGGYLSFAFEAFANLDAALRPAVDVLDRHGIHTLWVML